MVISNLPEGIELSHLKLYFEQMMCDKLERTLMFCIHSVMYNIRAGTHSKSNLFLYKHLSETNCASFYITMLN